MKLAVVVLNWNAADDTIRCVRSVLDWRDLQPVVWVVDNASRDRSVELIGQRCPEARLLPSATNRGFAGGNNLAIARALGEGSDVLLLLNNDAAIAEKDVALLIETLESDPQIGLVGPTMWDGDRLLSAGGRDIARHVVTHIRLTQPPAGLLEVDYVSGTVALVRAEVFNSLGLLDEGFFFSGEMADLCRRAWMGGYRCVIDGRTRAFHDFERSSEARDVLYVYYILRNRFLFIRKHYPAQKFFLFPFWVGFGFYLLSKALLGGNTRRARAVALGLLDGLAGRYGGQNERVLS
jgi:GT2 family glycosyltransferase